MRPLALLALVLPTLSLAAPAVNARSRIDSVTVYRSSARVFRASRLELQPGAARVLFEGLPDQLDDDSLRIEGKGSAKARVFGVTVERVTGEDAAGADARAAEERLQKLQDEDRGLEDRLKAAQARAKLVESLRSTYAEERAKNLALREVSTKEWRAVAAFVEAELTEISAEVRRLDGTRRELARRLAQARADLEKVQAKRGQTTKSVTVEVEAEKAGAFDVTLSYAVPAAGRLELAFLGSVWQRTGEDWSEVALSVSTAQPAHGLTVPQLDPRYLVRAEPPRPIPYATKRKSMPGEAAMPSAAARAPSPSMAIEEADAPKLELAVAQATVEEELLAAT